MIRDVPIKEEAYSAQSWNPWRVWQELSALESLLAGHETAMCMRLIETFCLSMSGQVVRVYTLPEASHSPAW